jgi:hypothetical protein
MLRFYRHTLNFAEHPSLDSIQIPVNGLVCRLYDFVCIEIVRYCCRLAIRCYDENSTFGTHYSAKTGRMEMDRTIAKLTLFFLFAFLTGVVLAQPSAAPAVRSQEISEDDGLPVLIKHLPEWQNVRSSTVFTTNAADLKNAVGDRPVLGQIDFAGGTEAVKADYPAGKLLIVEFTTPHASVDADARILQHLATNPEPATVYRRIGNYNAFVFDAADQEAAVGLLDQVKYEKSVQWLGEDPYLLRKIERYFAITTRDIMISTVLWIVGGLGISIVCGIVAGVIFYRVREQRRATWHAYSDAGGLIRLNLDELSE